MKRLLLFGLLFASLLAAWNVQVRTDASTLLPRDPALSATLAAAERTSGAKTLLIELDGSHVERGALKSAVEALAADLLALPIITSVRAGSTENEIVEIGRRMTPVLTSFVPEPKLRERTSPAGIRQILLSQQERLSGFAGMFLASSVADDPLDLRMLATGTLGAPELRVILEQGMLLDSDRKRALLIATTNRSPGAVQPDDPEIDALEHVLQSSALPVRWFGGLRLASGTASSVAEDVRNTSLIGVFLLALVMALGLRSWRPVVGATGPLVVAAGCTLIGAWWASPLHGIQLGFGAALAGLAVDYWIHLYLAAADRPGDREQAAKDALDELRPGLFLSAGSTAVAFAVLSQSELPVVRTLGWTGATASLGALAGVFLAGPTMIRWFGRETPRPPMKRPPVAGGVLASLILLGFFGMSTQFEADPMALIARPPRLQADQDWFAEHYGLSPARGLILLEGADAHDRAARIQTALDGLGIIRTQGPASVLPSPSQVRARRKSLPPVEVLQANLDSIGAELRMGPFPGAAQRIHDRAADVSPSLWEGTLLNDRALLGEEDALISVPVPDPSLIPALEDTLAAVDQARLVLPSAITEHSLATARDDLIVYGGFGGGVIFLLLLFRHRDPATALLALSPAMAAVIGSAGMMALSGQPWNPVSLAAMVPVLGLAVDYGVFSTEQHRSALRGISLSAATTLAGFLPLVIAQSPALSGVGIAMGAGVGSAALVALAVIPSALEGRPSARLRTLVERVALAGVLFLHLDIAWITFGAFTPPVPSQQLSMEVEQIGDERRAGQVRLVRSEGIHVLATSGDPYTLGWYARRVTAHLRPRLEEELFDSFSRNVPSMAFRWLITRGSVFAGLDLEDHILLPHRIEIQGGDDASEDPYWFAGPSYTRKIYYHALHDIGQALVDSPLLACTGFMAGPDATADGHWLLGRNFDFEGGVAFDRDKVLRVHTSDTGLSYMSIGFAGMIGAVSGVNEAGIAVAINASGSSDPPHTGTPMTLIVREILETASSLAEAETLLRERTGFVSENVLVVDADHNQAALFEVTPSQVQRLEVNGTLGVSNHFRTPAFAADPTNVDRMKNSTTVQRLARMDELLARHQGSISMDIGLDLLTDRRGAGDRELPVGHRHALDAHIATHGVVIDATTRTVRVSRFPNLTAGFVELSLADALAGELHPTEVRKATGEAVTAIGYRQGRELLRTARRSWNADALPLTEQALKRMPGHPEALFERGRVLSEAGRVEEGRELLEEALAIGVEYPHQREAIEALLHQR